MTDNTNTETNTTETTSMTDKLTAAGEKAVKQKAERRERVVKGSHLLPKLNELAKAAGLQTDEKTGFTKVSAGVKGKNIYIAKKGGRVDLSGFTVEADAVRQVSEVEAREKHLGKVRGQLDFNKSDDEVLAAFSEALTALTVAPPAAEKEEVEAPSAETEVPADAPESDA